MLTRPGGRRRVHRRRRQRGRRGGGRDDARRLPTPRPTRSGARSARTPASPRSCTRRTRCGTGTTTSARPCPHLFWAGQLPAERARRHERPCELRDLTPEAGPPHGAGDDFALSPDGRLAGPRRGGARRSGRATDPRRAHRHRDRGDPGARRRPAGRRLRRRASPPTAPRWSASARRCRPTPSRRTTRCCSSTWPTARPASSRPDFDRWPSAPQFSADGTAVYFLADDDGRHAIFRVPVDGGAPVRLTGDGAYSDLQVARDGSALYALRSAYDSPPRAGPAGPGRRRCRSRRCCRSPGTVGPLPGTAARGARRPPPTAPACSRGWCCPRAPRRRRRRRCCCGSTAAR